jgi:hypothetical protein
MHGVRALFRPPWQEFSYPTPVTAVVVRQVCVAWRPQSNCGGLQTLPPAWPVEGFASRHSTNSTLNAPCSSC